MQPAHFDFPSCFYGGNNIQGDSTVIEQVHQCQWTTAMGTFPDFTL